MNADPLEPEFEDDEQESGMTTMVNVSDDVIVVRISRGRRQHKVKIHPGKAKEFESAYCEDVKGAGKDVILQSILTRQTMKEDRVPRLVRRENAVKAREYFVQRTYGTASDAKSDVERLEEQLAAAKAKQKVLDERLGTPAAKAKKPTKGKGKPKD